MASTRFQQPSNDPFPATRWTMIGRAQGGETQIANEAWEQLVSAYWYPLYGFARRRGMTQHDAEDATQSFLSEVSSGRLLAKASPEDGRLRAFFLASFKLHLSNLAQKSNAQKRGGGVTHFSIDVEEAEGRLQKSPLENATSPEKWYDRQWADALLEEVLRRLEREYQAKGKHELFLAYRAFLVCSEKRESYQEIGTKLGMSESNVRVAIHRARKRYADITRTVISETVTTDEELEEELQYLMTVYG